MNTINELEQKLTFTPIAMKCNQEQFEDVKPLLERGGCVITSVDNFNYYDYLTNNYTGNKNDISNLNKKYIDIVKRDIYHEWDKKIFLNACGIEWVEEPTNPLDELPIIGDGVLMQVSEDEQVWYKRIVFAKYDKYFLAHDGVEDIKKVTYNICPYLWKYARPITSKTKITRKEFEQKFEIID